MHYFSSLTLDYILNYQGKVYFLVVACIKIVRYRIFLFFVASLYPGTTIYHLELTCKLHMVYAIYLSL